MPPHPLRRPVFVTGASSGIGEATACLLAAAGHPVALAARRMDRLEALAEKLRADGCEAAALPLDLTDHASISWAVRVAAAELGPIEVLVSVAGDVLPTKAHTTDPAEFARQVQVNLLSVQQLVAELVPSMVERGRGDVVVVTSDVVRTPRPTMSSYVSSKWGLEGLARAMQLDLEGTGVRCSIVRPGPTLTEMGSGFPAEGMPEVIRDWSRHGLLRHSGYLDPDGVAAAVAAVVATPRGTHLTLVEVEPEAPLDVAADPPGRASPPPPSRDTCTAVRPVPGIS